MYSNEKLYTIISRSFFFLSFCKSQFYVYVRIFSELYWDKNAHTFLLRTVLHKHACSDPEGPYNASDNSNYILY